MNEMIQIKLKEENWEFFCISNRAMQLAFPAFLNSISAVFCLFHFIYSGGKCESNENE